MRVKLAAMGFHFSRNLFFFLFLFFFLSLCLLRAAPAHAADPSYRVVRTIAAGGEGGWDYLTIDPSARRLYVSRSTRVTVLNADSGALEGEIPGTEGVHGIALAPELGRGFTSNGRANTVTIFDPKTLATLGTVKVPGENPDAILYDPLSHRVFTFNGRTANVTAIEGATGAVAGTFAVGGKPEFAVTDLAGRVYVNIEDKNEVVAFDSRTLKVEAHWALSGCEAPTGLAIDVKAKRLFAGCGNQVLVVLSTGDGRAVAKLPIGKGTDAVVFDPDSSLIFSSNGDGTLTIIHEDSPDTFHVVETSSFQLEQTDTFHPWIAVVLNFSPDHLDRHGSFENYARAKERIFAAMDEHDCVVLNADNAPTAEAATRTAARTYWFSLEHPVEQGAWLQEGSLVFRSTKDGEIEQILPLKSIPLKGTHNVENVLAGVVAARLAGVDAEAIRRFEQDASRATRDEHGPPPRDVRFGCAGSVAPVAARVGRHCQSRDSDAVAKVVKGLCKLLHPAGEVGGRARGRVAHAGGEDQVAAEVKDIAFRFGVQFRAAWDILVLG